MNPKGFFFVSETDALDVTRSYAGCAQCPVACDDGALFMSHPALFVDYDYALYRVLGEDAPDAMWEDLGRKFGLEHVCSVEP